MRHTGCRPASLIFTDILSGGDLRTPEVGRRIYRASGAGEKVILAAPDLLY